MCRKQELIQELMILEDNNPTLRINTPQDIYPALLEFVSKRQEHFIVVTLDGAYGVINVRVVSIGLVNRTVIHPREIFYPAVEDNAVAIIVAHNHPSGNLKPSEEDIDITKMVKKAGQIMGIQLLDHLIISKNGLFSLSEAGKL
jgi:DNA repair protein RadC